MNAGLSEKRPDSCGQAVQVPRLAFPDHENVPARFAQCGLVEPVTPDVPVQLVPPELVTLGRLRDAITRTPLVPMPEAAVHEDHPTSRAENKVGTAREVARVKAVAIPQAVYDPPNPHLGFRVLGPDSAHSFAAFTNRERVEAAALRVATSTNVNAIHGPDRAVEEVWVQAWAPAAKVETSVRRFDTNTR